ncbi:piggyBac transposable element-derived protein 2-like [Watersipora subatra]|uniref:piggyBac transposable element-derived protein 2-like n=1 Tax=Watersipora subatra TaxID=2589382 RepID=UPI00355B43A6
MANSKHLFDHHKVLDILESIDCNESEDGEGDDSEIDEDFRPDELNEEEDSECDDDDVPFAKILTKLSTKNMETPVFTWVNKKFKPPDSQFTGTKVAATDNQKTDTPLGYFQRFVMEKMIENIVNQTNVYSVQKNGVSINTTSKEIEQVLGMYFYMGLVRMDGVRQYWAANTRYDPVASVMSRNRFQQILRTLHFVDNMAVSDCTKKKDRLWKLRSWLHKMRENSLKLTPSEHCSINEMMCAYRGKTTSMRQYIKGKPHPWGF